MSLRLLPFITFTITFLLLANWHIFITTLTGLTTPQALYIKLEGQELSDYIREKTGVKINTFYMVNSDFLFGGMTGIPTKPIMTISRGMYESFSPQELHYILLHETGHYILNHLIKELIIQGGIILVAFLLFRSAKYSTLPLIILALVLAVVAAIAVIQIMRRFEWEADDYALRHLEQPGSMIEATKKLKAAWRGPDDNSLKQILFYRGVPYSQRIEHAQNFRSLNRL